MTTPRRRIDLKRLLPVWAQYALALVVAAGVMALALRVGRGTTGHPLLTPMFLAIWKWVALTVVVVAIAVGWLAGGARRRRARSNGPSSRSSLHE